MMSVQQVIDSAHLVPLPNGQTVMVGAPPEALKVLLLWEYPAPGVVVLPPDPLYANGINQASFEFLLYNHLFRLNGLRDRSPFTVVCDLAQRPRVANLVRQMLHGPSDAEMARWRTPASQRRQLLAETGFVSGEVTNLALEQMVRIIPFVDGCARLPDGTTIDNLPERGTVRIRSVGETAEVPRRAQQRAQLPLFFADVDTPAAGPRFGLQVIGSASGFCGAEWGSCFLIWINGLPLVVDGTPYLADHLRQLGIEDDHILGYLITHNHEDHANAIGQLINRRPVNILTSGPIMASLVARLSAILDCPESEVRQLFHWVPLHPGTTTYGEPLHWFGAEIRTWYSVHTIPTLGVDVSMGGKHIRMPGDTLWGRQLDPLLERKIISQGRYDFIQHTYDGADVIVADAGGGPIHPDPEEVRHLAAHDCDCKLLVTHIPEAARELLPTADPGTHVTLLPREERSPEEAMALFGSPLLRELPERWLLALLYGGEVSIPEAEALEVKDGAVVVLAGSASLCDGTKEQLLLQRGDVYHPSLTPQVGTPTLVPITKWTRLLHVPEKLYQALLKDTGLGRKLTRVYQSRGWWREVTGQELGLDTIVALARLCRERVYEAGQDIVRQGQPAHHFYVVTEGLVEVLRKNGTFRRVGGFGPGYHFGEIALLGEEPLRTATVRAVERTRVLEVPGRAFRRHLMDIPLARYTICQAAQRRRDDLLRRAIESAP